MATTKNEGRQSATETDEQGLSAAQLAHRISAGDKRAESIMVHRYEPDLRRRMAMLIGNPDDANDLIQELWMVALPKLRAGALDTPATLSAWLRGIARMLARPYWREQLRRRAELDVDETLVREDPAPGPCEQIVLKERAQAMRKIACDLPQARDREVILHGVFADESPQAMRRRTGLSTDQYYRVLSRARKRFVQAAQPLAESL